MDNIDHVVVEYDEADEMIDKYFRTSIYSIGDRFIKGYTNFTRNGMPVRRTLYLVEDRLYHYYEIYNTNNELLMRGYARYYISRSSDDRYTYIQMKSTSHKYSLFEFPKGGNDPILVTGGCNTVESGKNYTVDELAGPCATIKTLVIGEDGFKFNTSFASLDNSAKLDIFEGLDMFQSNGIEINTASSTSEAKAQMVNEIKNFDFNFELIEDGGGDGGKDDSAISILPFLFLVIMAILMF